MNIVCNVYRTYRVNNCSLIGPQRLLDNFKEIDYEKVYRLYESNFKYFYKVRLVGEEIERNGDEEDEDEMYLKRLEGGSFALHNRVYKNYINMLNKYVLHLKYDHLLFF